MNALTFELLFRVSASLHSVVLGPVLKTHYDTIEIAVHLITLWELFE